MYINYKNIKSKWQINRKFFKVKINIEFLIFYREILYPLAATEHNFWVHHINNENNEIVCIKYNQGVLKTTSCTEHASYVCQRDL